MKQLGKINLTLVTGKSEARKTVLKMPFSSKCPSENISSSSTPEFIDIKEFCDRCAVLKNDIRLNKEIISDFDKHILDDHELAAVNPDLVSKWEKIFSKYTSSYQNELDELISHEDAALASDQAKKEAALARRIVKNKLLTVEAFRLENLPCCMKSPKSMISSPSFNSSVSLPGNVTELKMKPEPVSASDVIITISIFPGGKSANLQSAHKQELEVKASDSLLAFTEGIYCLSTRVAYALISDPSDSEILDSSAFLFIEGAFYDDEMDLATHLRPSDTYYEALKLIGTAAPTINTFLSNSGSVQRGSLKETKWNDLKIRLNTPYLFVHLGGCEHVFTISNIRAASLSDENKLFLPRISQALRVRRRKCRICEIYAGTKMLINDKLMPENPCIICDKCYEGFHGSDQEWYEDFEVVPYYHEA